MSEITTRLLDETIAQIQAVLEELRPTIVSDGGDIIFERFEEGTVFVRLHGACVSCPISYMTLSMGVEATLKQRIPAVQRVALVDDEV
jgi:Fe-S cluster biogenesis protein NfuA